MSGSSVGDVGWKPKQTCRRMCFLVVAMFYNVKGIVPLFVAPKVSVKSMNQDPIDNLCLAIRLRMECSRKLEVAPQ